MALSRTQYEDSKRALNEIDEACGRDGRAPDAGEKAAYAKHTLTMEAYQRQMETEQRYAATAAVTAGLNGGRAVGAPAVDAMPTMGAQLLSRGKAALGRAGNEKFRTAIAEDEEMSRVLAHGQSSDATSPTTIEGPLTVLVDANRRAINASTRYPIPDNRSPKFLRPLLTQGTAVGVQGSEGDVLDSQRATVTGVEVDKVTVGGTLAMSQQQLDWSEPEFLQLAIQDLMREFAIESETLHCAAIEAQADQASAVVCSLTAASDVFLKALTDAAAVVYTASGYLPDRFFVSPSRWSYLCSLVDANKRNLFPISTGQNVSGENVGGVSTFTGFNIFGMDVIVSPRFQTDTWAVAASSLVEYYETGPRTVTVNVPSTLEVQYSVAAYVASRVITQAVCGLEAS